MLNLYKTSEIVKEVLETIPETRNSDSYLYLKVLEYISEKEGYGLKFMTVQYFLENISFYGFPPSESVRRARQKLQAKYPHLRGNSVVGAHRAAREEEHRAYAKSELKEGVTDGRS